MNEKKKVQETMKKLVFFFCIVMIGGFGLVTTIYAKSEEPIRVEKIERVSPSFYTRTVAKGKTIYLKVNVLPNDAENQDLKWTTSNKKIATVSSTGKVKGVKNGNAIITASATDGSKKKVTWKVTVGTPTTGIKTDQEEIRLLIGEKKKISANVVPTNASNKKIQYTVKDKKIATIEKDGTITGVSKGETIVTIEALDGRSSAVVKIVVEEKEKENNLIITKENLKQTALLSGGVYDTITIDGDIGTTKLMMLGVTVKNGIVLQNGGTYELELMNCKVQRIQSGSNTQGTYTTKSNSPISNGYPTTQIAPSIVAKTGTNIEGIYLYENAEVHCISDAKIGDIQIETRGNSSIIAKLENVRTNLMIQAKEMVLLDVMACEFQEVNISGSIKFHDLLSGIASSKVQYLSLSGEQETWVVDVKATQIEILAKARNCYGEFSRSADSIINHGVGNSLYFVNANTSDHVVHTLTLSGYGGMTTGDGSMQVGLIKVQGSAVIIERSGLGNPGITIGTYAFSVIVDGIVKQPGTVV